MNTLESNTKFGPAIILVLGPDRPNHPELAPNTDFGRIYVLFFSTLDVSLISVRGEAGCVEHGNLSVNPSSSVVLSELMGSHDLRPVQVDASEKSTVMSAVAMIVQNSELVLSKMVSDEPSDKEEDVREELSDGDLDSQESEGDDSNLL
jgi:hypothetical protein